MKILLNSLLGVILIVVMLVASLFVLNLLLSVIFSAIDYSPILGGALIVVFFVAFSVIGGLAKTREYFPGIKKFFPKK